MHQYHHRLLFKAARGLTGHLRLTLRVPVRRFPLTAEIRKFANIGSLETHIISILIKYYFLFLTVNL